MTERRGLARLAGGAEPEQLEPVFIDAVAGPPCHLENHGAQPFIGDVGHPPAARADDVVVVERLADDVGVLSARQIDSLDRVQLDEDIQRPEHGRPAHSEATGSRVRNQVGGSEVALVLGNQGRQSTAWPGQPVAGPLESCRE